jgi:hypothetical protein
MRARAMTHRRVLQGRWDLRCTDQVHHIYTHSRAFASERAKNATPGALVTIFKTPTITDRLLHVFVRMSVRIIVQKTGLTLDRKA